MDEWNILRRRHRSKDISAGDLINDIKTTGKTLFMPTGISPQTVKPHLPEGSVLLADGARDPSLETFAQSVFEQL